jgi:hypothetical protein
MRRTTRTLAKSEKEFFEQDSSEGVCVNDTTFYDKRQRQQQQQQQQQKGRDFFLSPLNQSLELATRPCTLLPWWSAVVTVVVQ